MSDPGVSSALTGGAFVIFVVGVLLALPISYFVIKRYQRAVRRAMMAIGSHADTGASDLNVDWATGGASQDVRIVDLSQEKPQKTETSKAIGAKRFALTLVYLLSGFVFALSLTGYYFWINEIPVLPQRFLGVASIMAWPAVFVTSRILSTSVLQQTLLFGAYFALLGELTSTLNANHFVLFAIFMALPTLSLLLLFGGMMRTVGPFMFVIMVFTALMANFSIDVMDYLAVNAFVTTAPQLYGAGAATVLLGLVLGVLALYVLAAAYARKWMSDDVIYLFVSMLIFSFWLSLLSLATYGPIALLGLFTIVPFLLALRIGFYWVRGIARDTHVPLLYLRVFKKSGGDGRLFERFSRTWRMAGNVQLIGAPDLASQTLDPPRLFAYLMRRLRSLFIGSRDDLSLRLSGMDTRPDQDGRYRVNEFFCHDNIWRAAIDALADDARVYMNDLRGFQIENRGAVWEIGYLFEKAEMSRVISVIDKNTDQAALEQVAHAAKANITSASPNYNRPAELLVLDCDELRGRTVHRLAAWVAAAEA